MVQGDSVWLWLASISTAKPATKYQPPASATLRGSERTEANTPRLTQHLPKSRQHPQRLRREFPEHRREQDAGDAGGQELLDRLVNHGVGETRMVPARSRPHLDPDHHRRQHCGRRPAGKEGKRIVGGIVEPVRLQERGAKRDAAGRGHRRGAIAAKRRTRGELAANGDNVGQGLVEIAHLAAGPINFASQSISDSKANARAGEPACSIAGFRREISTPGCFPVQGHP